MKEENAIQPTKEDLSHLFKIEEGLKKYIYHDHLSLSREDLWETLLNVTFDRFFYIESLHLKEFIDDLERRLIIRTMFKANGIRKEAAKLLGIKYTTLHEKLRKHNIRFRNMAY